MVFGKIVRLKTVARHQGHRQGVPEGKLQGGAAVGAIKRTRPSSTASSTTSAAFLRTSLDAVIATMRLAAGQCGKQLHHLFALPLFASTE